MLDILGCPINIDDMVLTTGYCSSSLNVVAIVEKVNKKSITVTVKADYWDWDEKKRIHYNKHIRRKRDQVVVINQQLKYIQEHFPENLI
jgi:formylmethanofuran dehydrogenase subunit E